MQIFRSALPLQYLSLETLTYFKRTGVSILVALIGLVSAVIILLSLTTLSPLTIDFPISSEGGPRPHRIAFDYSPAGCFGFAIM